MKPGGVQAVCAAVLFLAGAAALAGGLGMAAASRSANEAEDRARRTLADAREIEALRLRRLDARPASQREPDPHTDLVAIAAQAGIPNNRLGPITVSPAALDPVAARTERRLRVQPCSITLPAVDLPALGRFLDFCRRADPPWQAVELSIARSQQASNDHRRPDLWSATIKLEARYADPGDGSEEPTS